MSRNGGDRRNLKAARRAFAASACLLAAGCARNEPPAISVGPDLNVDAGERVTLTGAATDPEGSALAYRWEQLQGEPIELSNAEHPDSAFTAPVVETATTLTFRLTATDDGGAAAAADMAVTVEPYGRLNVALSGTVRNHATHAPIAGASVTVSQFGGGGIPHRLGDTLSDANGAYAVEIPANPGRLAVHAEADGFAAQSAVVALLEENAGRSVHLDMVPVQAVREFATAEGADVGVDGQSVVTLPGNAMTIEDGDAYTGRAVASVAVLDPSRDPSVMPGDFRSWNTDSQSAAPIESYGAVSVDLRADNGAPLHLATGDVAQLSIPLANARSPQDAPPTMPLYYWSGELGYWIEEGEARLAEVSPGNWAYVGAVGHFSTWNADVVYESVSITGCVLDGNGDPVGYAELTARGIDYTGTSSAVADADGRFEIEVRPNSELELVAASDEASSDAMAISSGDGDFSLELCLVVQGERGLEDFPVRIEGETGTIDICVRDHECEDGDAIDVDVDGRNVFSGEIVNDAMCSALEVEAGREYVIELTALNGTGFKGACNFADANTGEIVVRGLNSETQVWRHREGAGSQAWIVVTAGVPQPFTIVPTPPDATVDFAANVSRGYESGMELPAGDYRVEVSAPGYETREVTVAHGVVGPTIFEVVIERVFEPGEEFSDALASGGQGPEMVVIPAGRFRMGCVSGHECLDWELPVHDVTIAQALAVAKYEVTFAQWDACMAGGGCGDYRPDDAGWGRGGRPVINVSWDDAQEYVAWLSRQTGQTYRLLSEAEWEYVARAGSETMYSWGNDIGSNRANCNRCGSQWDDRQTAPSGSFSPNAFGVHDMHGNVWEWVADCWTDSYAGAPSDGSPRRSGECDQRVLRGGALLNPPQNLRSATRNRLTTGGQGDSLGFRVARTLTP